MRQLFKSPPRIKGFTLIELLFAMSFVSVLLILILTSTLQITRIYNKGITLKQVNQAGAALGGELQSSLKAADAPLITDSLLNGDKTGGRLCLGTYSYVWNLKDAATNKYDSDPNTRIGLVEVSDPTSAMCDGTPAVPKDRATELILGAAGSSGVQLQLRDVAISQTAASGSDYIYSVSYTISTDDQTLIEASTDGDVCKGGASDEFCALNRFTFDVFMRKGGSGRVE